MDSCREDCSSEIVETFTKARGILPEMSPEAVGMHLLMTSTVSRRAGKQGPRPGTALMLWYSTPQRPAFAESRRDWARKEGSSPSHPDWSHSDTRDCISLHDAEPAAVALLSASLS